MLSSKNKLDKFRNQMQSLDLDACLVNQTDEFQNEFLPDDSKRLEWISNFSGSAGIAVILRNKNYLFTDGRYTIQSQIESGKNFKIISYEKIINCGLFKNLTLGIDPKLITYDLSLIHI